MKSTRTWKLILSSLQQKIPVMLLYVLESKGSSPGRQGFFMAVTASGHMEGSIGGGIMEHKFVELAKEKLRAGNRDPGVRTQIHDKSAAENQSGMICSGEQTMLLYPVHANDANYIQQLISSEEDHRNGTLTLSPAGLSFATNIPSKEYEFEWQTPDDWFYRERTGYKNKLYIIGGGHCALALSRLMRGMDFYIHVYDDRENLNTLEQNDAAHEKITVDDYTAISQLIPSGPNQFVVIMTMGYRTDDLAVRALWNRKFHYIGLLGSVSKINKMMADYREEGLDPTWMQYIHAPIGVPIKSQTPEEIAVSIAAEIISVKNHSLS